MQNKTILAALDGMTATLAAQAQADTFDCSYIGVKAGWSRAETADTTIEGQPLDAETLRDALAIGFPTG